MFHRTAAGACYQVQAFLESNDHHAELLVPCCSVHLDEADNDAVDALMGMTGLLYAH